jgi:hypothetical protein
VLVAFQSKTVSGQQVKTSAQINALNSLLDGANMFRQAMSESRETVRGWLQASRDTESLFFLDKAVQLCTNSVRKELYTGRPYPAILISPLTLRQKVHSLRNQERSVQSELRAQSQQAQQARQRDDELVLKQQQQAAQAAQAEQAAIAATLSFYANCTDADIAGSQAMPTTLLGATNRGCRARGQLIWGNLVKALQYGVRAERITLERDWPFAFSVRGKVDYGNSAPSNLTKVGDHFAADVQKRVLLGPTTYSIDGGNSWQDIPFTTSPALEEIKRVQSSKLIEEAKLSPQGSGCPFRPPHTGAS